MFSFKRYITEVAKFSPKNFPSDHGNNKFSGAGERTTYTPTQARGTFKYSDGFPVEKDTYIYTSDGQQAKLVKKGDKVHFTYPAKLYKNDEIGIRARGTFAEVSTKGHDKKPDGFIAISAVIKPAGGAQNRVAAGAATQKLIADKVEAIAFENGQNYEFVSTARPGSTAPDLVVSIDGKNIQFEIKGTSSGTAPVTFFDKSVSRARKTPNLINQIAMGFIDAYKLPLKGKDKSFVGAMDYYRGKDKTVGLAGDSGAPRSGKLPKEFTTTDKALMRKMHAIIVDHFKEGGDNYFVIHNRSTDDLQMYYTGHGQNHLKLPKLPQFKSFSLATYGGASSGSTRVGLKIKL